MSLNIGRALQEGIGRTISRVGLLLAVVWGVLVALNMLAYNSLLVAFTAGTATQPTMIGPALDVSPTLAGVSLFVLYLASFVVVAAALRTFVTDETRRIPGKYVTRNLGGLLPSFFVGYVVFFLAIWVGFLLLFVPGVFLMVSPTSGSASSPSRTRTSWRRSGTAGRSRGATGGRCSASG